MAARARSSASDTTAELSFHWEDGVWMALRDILPKGDGEKAAVRPTAAAMVRAAAVRLGRGIVLCVLFYVLFNSSSMQELFSRYIYLSLLVDQLKAIFMILSSKRDK
mmetsp:Transcript_5011/g.11107  ORF Transcript_5011/g.11107 Transcript_5011/m.11107 type:complete len:107 (+) Transcript_5011:2329-2649(+)